MSRRRFYTPPSGINGSVAMLPASETHHLSHVLRLKPGTEVFLFDGRGREYRCRLSRIVGSHAELEIVATLPDRVESTLNLTLAQALAKADRFDLIVQKATELGVSRIFPLVTDHCNIHIKASDLRKKVERWERIALEALKQCGRRTLVEITEPMSLQESLNSLINVKEEVFVFSERNGRPISEMIEGQSRISRAFAVVGPEGGWSDQEAGMFDELGFATLTLGPRLLRTETASIVAVALLQHLIGDLSAKPRPV